VSFLECQIKSWLSHLKAARGHADERGAEALGAAKDYVRGREATGLPLMDGEAAVGSSPRFANEAHVHPTDDTRAPARAVADVMDEVHALAGEMSSLVAGVAPPATSAGLMQLRALGGGLLDIPNAVGGAEAASRAGIMSAADKRRLDAQHDSAFTGVTAPANGTALLGLSRTGAGVDVTLPRAVGGTDANRRDGIMSGADKQRLDALHAGALGEATPTALGLTRLSNRAGNLTAAGDVNRVLLYRENGNIGGAVDLNTFAETGFYAFRGVTTATNFPLLDGLTAASWQGVTANNTSMLAVYRTNAGSAQGVFQMLYRTGGEVYWRRRTSTTAWSAWQRRVMDLSNVIPSRPTASGTLISGTHMMGGQQWSGTLDRGWYRVLLAGAEGGAGGRNPGLAPGGAGGNGGLAAMTFFVPMNGAAMLYSGARGEPGLDVGQDIGGGGGGGGGGSALVIAELGILIFASGGGGGGGQGTLSPDMQGGSGGAGGDCGSHMQGGSGGIAPATLAVSGGGPGGGAGGGRGGGTGGTSPASGAGTVAASGTAQLFSF